LIQKSLAQDLPKPPFVLLRSSFRYLSLSYRKEILSVKPDNIKSWWGRTKPCHRDSWDIIPDMALLIFRVKNDGARAGGSGSLRLAFFLESLFSWQKWRSKPPNRRIFHTTPSVFHVVVLVRPRNRTIEIGLE
jgi:hypothetical protein